MSQQTGAGEDDATVPNPTAIVLVMGLAIIVDAVIVPTIIAAPGLAVLVAAPEPWNLAGLFLLIPVAIYMVLYLFIRDTDDAWPFAPAESVLFSNDAE